MFLAVWPCAAAGIWSMRRLVNDSSEKKISKIIYKILLLTCTINDTSIYMGSYNMVKSIRCGGGVGLRVLICAVSLLALAGAIVALLQTFESRKADDHRRAETISDYGLMTALEKLGVERDWNEGFKDEPYPYDDKGGTFSVTLTREERDGALYVKVVSTGVSGSVTKTQERELRLDADAPEGDSASLSNEGGGAEE